MSICWQCGNPAGDELFCVACGTLQPPPSDYYKLLGFPRMLALPAEQLQGRFYTLSRLLHPDRFMRKSERERQYSLDASSLLNDAYRTLRHPVSRAEYVLKISGFDTESQRTNAVPPELLAEVFELNEALEELKDGDATVRTQLEEARDNFQTLLHDCDAQLESLFHQYDTDPASDALSRIRGVLNRRKYIQNLVFEVEGALAPANPEP